MVVHKINDARYSPRDADVRTAPNGWRWIRVGGYHRTHVNMAMNEKGVAVTTNGGDRNRTGHPRGERLAIGAPQLETAVMQNCATAAEGVEVLKNAARNRLFFNSKNYGYILLVADARRAFVVEIGNGYAEAAAGQASAQQRYRVVHALAVRLFEGAGAPERPGNGARQPEYLIHVEVGFLKFRIGFAGFTVECHMRQIVFVGGFHIGELRRLEAVGAGDLRPHVFIFFVRNVDGFRDPRGAPGVGVSAGQNLTFGVFQHIDDGLGHVEVIAVEIEVGIPHAVVGALGDPLDREFDVFFGRLVLLGHGALRGIGLRRNRPSSDSC